MDEKVRGTIEELGKSKITKAQAIVIVTTLLAPVVAGVTSYEKSVADIRQEFAVMRLERERDYVKKDDLKRILEKVDRIADDVSQIKGYLEYKQERKRGN